MEQQGYFYISMHKSLMIPACILLLKERGFTVSCAKMYEYFSPLVLQAPEIWRKTDLTESFITQLLKTADES